MLRFRNPQFVTGARQIFEQNLEVSLRVGLEEWRKSRTWWSRLKQRWAYFLVARLDPLLVRWQHRRLPR